MSMRTHRRIGLTGGIGAGKTTVTQRLITLGAAVLDADAASRVVVEPGSPGLAALKKRFGDSVIRADGCLDRRKLADLTFTDAIARRDLNDILHPLVMERMFMEEIAVQNARPGVMVIFDVPLLMESGMHEMMDAVWLVVAPEEVRLKRILARDRCPEAAARARIASQMPDADKLQLATDVIHNDSNIPALYAKVDALYLRELRRQA